MPTEKKFFLAHWGDCLRDRAGQEARSADIGR